MKRFIGLALRALLVAMASFSVVSCDSSFLDFVGVGKDNKDTDDPNFVTPEMAESYARACLSASVEGVGKKLKFDIQSWKSDDGVLLYILNSVDKDGFALVSGDLRIPKILAYSYYDYFDAKELSFILEDFADRIIETKGSATRASSQDYKPDIIDKHDAWTIRWGQHSPYNAQCPIDEDTGEHMPTGCVITASAEIMAFHRWPSTYDGRELHWDHMLKIGSKLAGDPVGSDDVAFLMREIGINVYAKYNINGTSASAYNAAKCFNEHNYDAQLFNTFDIDDVMNEIRNDRPVYVSGNNGNSSAHAYVADGFEVRKDGKYIDYYFHLNNIAQSEQNEDYYFLFGDFGYDVTRLDYITIRPDKTEPTSEYEIDPGFLNFKSVKIGESKSLPIKITNTGETELEFTLSCTSSCFTISEEAFSLRVGKGEKVVDVTFRPKAEKDYSAKLLIECPGCEDDEVSLSGSGYADQMEEEPELFVNTDELSFKKPVHVGTSASHKFIIANKGSGVLKGDISTTDNISVEPDSFVLAEGEDLEIKVTFRPDGEGWFEEEVNIKSNGGNHTVYVYGTGEGSGPQIEPKSTDGGQKGKEIRFNGKTYLSGIVYLEFITYNEEYGMALFYVRKEDGGTFQKGGKAYLYDCSFKDGEYIRNAELEYTYSYKKGAKDVPLALEMDSYDDAANVIALVESEDGNGEYYYTTAIRVN